MKKNKLKYLFVMMVSFIIFTIIGVYATNTLNSNLVSYDSSNSSLTSTNVQDAIDELYTNITTTSTSCPNGYLCKERKSTPEPGDYVKMTPTLTSYTTDTSKTGYTSRQTINPSELNLWRVLKVNSDGTMELISEYTSSTNVYFSGETGYKNFVGYLNVLASKYENSKYTKGSRYVGYNGQTEYITDTSALTSTTAPWTSSTGSNTVESQGGGDTLYQSDYDLMQSVLGTRVAYKVNTKSSSYYWLASRYYRYSSSTFWLYYGRDIYTSGSLNYYNLYYYDSGSFKTITSRINALRPIVILKSGISFSPAVGTSDDPFVLE